MHVTMIVKSDVSNDARVRREAVALARAGHDVLVIGETRPRDPRPLPGVEVRWTMESATGAERSLRGMVPGWVRWLGLPTHRRRAIRRFERRAVDMALGAPSVATDVVHAHDLSALGAATEVASAAGARLVYDAHECWVGRRLEGRPEPLGRWVDRRRERRLGSQATAVLTVSPGIAMWFRHQYGWGEVEVVRNTFPPHPHHAELPPLPVTPTAAVYAGRIDAKRDLETAVAGFADHPVGLCVVGAGDESVASMLSAAGIEVLPMAPIDEVDVVYRRAGLALVPLADDQLNHELALPNKLFHAVRAGVPVIAADLPEISRVVHDHGIGELYTPGDTRSLRAAVDRAVGRYAALCEAVERAAPALTWPHDEATLLSVYEQLATEAS